MVPQSYRFEFFLSILSLFLAAGVAAAESKSGESAQQVLAKFAKDDPGWTVRMQSLARLANLGPDAVPHLVEALRNRSPTTREFAAQALVMFNEPAARPALEKAVSDPKSTVRIYAIQALRTMGPLTPADPWEKLRTDPDRGVRTTVGAALDSKEDLSPEALRRAWAGYDLTKVDSAHVGQLAPEFTLMAHSGKTIQLRDYRGKKDVVLRYFKLDY